MTDADFMRLAIQAAWQGLEKGEMPFGASIVRRGQVVAVAHNSANANLDTTSHAAGLKKPRHCWRHRWN